MNQFEPVSMISAIIGMALSVGMLVFTIGGGIQMFRKAGVPGIFAIIPLVNSWQLMKITWGKGWYMLLLFIPIVNLVIWVIICGKLAAVFGKGMLFAVGLFFLSPFFVGFLGWGEAEYLGPQ